MNKYLISVDIEGISGVASREFSSASGKLYELGKRFMLHNTNAVVEGILQADPAAWIVVRDAHNSAQNLDFEKLHPKANLVQGWGNSMNMVSPVDKSYKGVFLVGYHAGGHNNDAVLAHTYAKFIHSLKINDKIIDEAGIAALYAGIHNVPVAFLSGDNLAVAAAKEQLPDIVGVVVKESLARDSVLSYPLAKAQELLISGAKLATQNLLQNKFKPFKLSVPFKAELKIYNIGYHISIFQKLYKTFELDKVFEFDLNEFSVKFISDSTAQFLQRFEVLMQCLYSYQ